MKEVVDYKEVDRVATWAAARYMGKKRYAGTFRDLQQEARLAVLIAQRSYKPELGPFGSYACSAAIRHLHGYTCKTTSMVTGSLHSLDILQYYRHATIPLEFIRNLASEHEDARSLLWRDEVHRAAKAALENVGPIESILLVVCGESTPAVEAKRAGVPLRQFYRMTALARELLGANSRLWALWKEQD